MPRRRGPGSAPGCAMSCSWIATVVEESMEDRELVSGERIDGEEKNLKEGEIWEISNVNKMHSVRNGGQKNRVHLLIDYAPLEVWEKYFINS